MADEIEKVEPAAEQEPVHTEPFVLKPKPEPAPVVEAKKPAPKEEASTSPFSVTVRSRYASCRNPLSDPGGSIQIITALWQINAGHWHERDPAKDCCRV